MSSFCAWSSTCNRSHIKSVFKHDWTNWVCLSNEGSFLPSTGWICSRQWNTKEQVSTWLNEADATQLGFFTRLELHDSSSITSIAPWQPRPVATRSLQITVESFIPADTCICKNTETQLSPHGHLFLCSSALLIIIIASSLAWRCTKKRGAELTLWGSLAGPAPKLIVWFCSMMNPVWCLRSAMWFILLVGLFLLCCALCGLKWCVHVLLVNSGLPDNVTS